MTTFTNRVSAYPAVEETVKVISGAYDSAKSHVAIISSVENAAATLAEKTKPLVSNAITIKLDELACRYILDRVEQMCPSIKERKASEIVDCVADRALNIAEGCANYCLPPDEIDTTTPGEEQLSHRERLAHLQKRATEQAVKKFHSSLDEANSRLKDIHSYATNAINRVPTATVLDSLSKVTGLIDSAYTTAKDVGTPYVVTALNGLVAGVERLNVQMKQLNTLNKMDLQLLIDALSKLQQSVSPRIGSPTTEVHEMQTLGEHATHSTET